MAPDPHPVTIFVCTGCRAPDAAENADMPAAGEALVVKLAARIPDDGSLRVVPVECLAVCGRPCTIAFAAPDKWTYLIGDIDPEHDSDDIILAAKRLSGSPAPVLALADRPSFFRKGVIGRVPSV